MWLAVLVALHLLLGLLLYEPILFPGGDNAHYMILADALRDGSGYRDIHVPGAPLHTKYPPGFPGLLAVLGVAGGVQLFKLAMLALTSTAVVALALYGRARFGDAVALVAAGLLAVNPVLLEYGHYVLSEAPFLAWSGLALWLAVRERPRAWLGAIGFALLAFFTRTAGLALLAALPLGWWWMGRRRDAAVAAGAGLLSMVAWGGYQRWAAPDRAGYLGELLLRDPYTPEAGRITAPGLISRAADNAWNYVGQVLPESVTGAASWLGTGALAVLGITLLGLALIGWVRKVGSSVGPVELFVLLYAGLISLWPEVWTDQRFLLPVIPAVLLFVCAGARDLAVRGGEQATDRRAGLALGLLSTVIAVPAVAATVEKVPARVACITEFRAGTPCDAPAYASLYAAARWARDATPPDAIIANRKPTLFFWYSRRQGDLYRYSSDPGAVMAGLDAMGADYVVVDQVSGTTYRYLIPAIQSAQARFEPVYEGGEPPTYVLRLHPAPTTALNGQGAPAR